MSGIIDHPLPDDFEESDLGPLPVNLHRPSKQAEESATKEPQQENVFDLFTAVDAVTKE